MGTVIAFPTERCVRQALEAVDDAERDNVVVLPVIRIERHCALSMETAPHNPGPGRTPRRPGSRP